MEISKRRKLTASLRKIVIEVVLIIQLLPAGLNPWGQREDLIDRRLQTLLNLAIHILMNDWTSNNNPYPHQHQQDGKHSKQNTLPAWHATPLSWSCCRDSWPL